jgi:DNA polymerase-3 subunit epsilon
MTFKFFITDTETTGKIIDRARSHDPGQPYVVSLAGLLCDVNLNILQSFDCLIKPVGFDSIPKEATEVNGITIEMCHDIGVNHLAAMSMWKSMAEAADLIAGHNCINFDARVMRIMFKRAEKDAEWIENLKYICTMKEADKIMKLPPTERMKNAGFGWKTKPPNLEEAYAFFTRSEENPEGLKHVRAHTAIGDCLASREVLRGLISQGHIPDIVAWTAERGTKAERKDEYAEKKAGKASAPKAAKAAPAAKPAAQPKAAPAAKTSPIDW